jgi:hypothetical protein
MKVVLWSRDGSESRRLCHADQVIEHQPLDSDPELVAAVLSGLSHDAPATPLRLLEKLRNDPEVLAGLGMEDAEPRRSPYRLIRSDSLLQAQMSEESGIGELTLFVAGSGNLIVLAPHLAPTASRPPRMFVGVSRGQWDGRADAALQWAVRISGYEIDGVALTQQRGRRSALPGLAMEGFGTDPAGRLWDLGFNVDPPQPGWLLVMTSHLFLPGPGQGHESWLLPYLGAAVGPLLAAWPEESPDLALETPTVLVLLSVDDDPSIELAQQLARAAKRRGLGLVVRYAMHRYIDGGVNAGYLVQSLDEAVVEAPGIQWVVVHHGAAFAGDPQAYRSALQTFRDKHAHIELATEVLPVGSPAEVNGIWFEQSVVCDFVINLLSF